MGCYIWGNMQLFGINGVNHSFATGGAKMCSVATSGATCGVESAKLTCGLVKLSHRLRLLSATNKS